jgi:hypothetical protein
MPKIVRPTNYAKHLLKSVTAFCRDLLPNLNFEADSALGVSERSGRPLTEEAGGLGAGFQQEGQ